MRTLPTLLVTLILLLPGSASADDAPTKGLLLATDGQPARRIVMAETASDETKAVIQELAEYLELITGATFELATGDGSEGIVVGTLTEFPDATLNKPLEIRGSADGREAFAIRTDSKRLRLIGATDLGVSHAVFRFLESLGCRWFFPAKAWEVVPKIDRLEVNINETDRPVILSRRIWIGYGHYDKRFRADYEAWARHNRMAMSRRIACGHAWQAVILANQKEFDAHPEYRALVMGERQGWQLCVSNPAVRKLAVDWALNLLRRFPDRDMVSMETSDGHGHCECEQCLKLGSVSDRAFGLANEVARAVDREFPGKMVGMLAYSDHSEPPQAPLEPNVYVQSTAGFINGKYTFEELVDLWKVKCKNYGFYEYFSVWLWDFDMPLKGRGGDLKYIQDRIKLYDQVGATSLDCESGNNWGPHGRGYYIANKLMWNPKADLDALLADFYDKAFGPAAAAMERYYERMHKGNEPLLSEHLLAMALRDLQEATTLAQDRPDVLARLDHLKQYHHYVRLRWEYELTQDKDRKKQLALAAFTQVYRNRYSHMNHWQAIRTTWVGKMATDFGEPEWARGSRAKKPWEIDVPQSPAETAQNFIEDLAYFQPQPLEEITFSEDLVPLGQKTDSPAESWQRYQRSMRYALYSPQGGPLEFAITTGIIVGYRNRPDLRYKLTDSSGKQIAAGRLPQDGNEHPISIKVPSVGLYWLDVNDSSVGWGVRAAAGQSISVALARSRRAHHLGQMKPMYFYVPKGTKQIQYYWKGGKHTVAGPDGKPVAEVTDSGKFITIKVPPRQDGKTWSLQRMSLGHLWFFNVPNYLAASPDALLVPREVLEKAKGKR